MIESLRPLSFLKHHKKNTILYQISLLTCGWLERRAPVDVRLLGGDGGRAAVGACGRHHGGRGSGGRVVAGDLARDGAELRHGDRTQTGALRH